MIEKLSFRLLPFFATILLAAACQELEPVTATEQEANPVSERATIPFSLTVLTEGTKVSYAEGIYQFKDGDIIHIAGLEDRTDIYGDLTQNGAVWSGTLSYLVEKGQPTSETPLKATLIHADNADESTYASAVIGTVPAESTALREAVEHYSLFTTELTFGTTSATLYQQATFLDVTVTFDFDGSHHPAAGGEALVDLATTRGTTTVRTSLIPMDNSEDFQAKFMAVIPGGQTVGDFSLTVGDRKVAFSDNSLTLAANKKYNVSRTIEFRPQLGDPLWNDGTYGRLRPADPNAYIVGIIVYVNHNYTDPDKAAIDDAITEKAAGYGHGLVMALHNAKNGNNEIHVKWSEAAGKVQCTSNFVTTPSQTLLAQNLSGHTNTNSILSTLGASAVSAASIATSYPVTAPANTTGWFLPTIGQWMYTISIDGFGGVNPASEWFTSGGKNWLTQGNLTGDLVFVKECDETRVNMMIKALNDRLELLQNDFSDYSLTYDSFGDPSASNNISDNYWTSTEFNKDSAIRMNLGTVEKKGSVYYSTLKARYETKTNIKVYSLDGIDYKMKVRSFLAF